MKLPWIQNPNTKQPDVALTMLVIGGLLMVIGAGLEMFVTIKASSLLEGFFYSALALFFGRSVNIRGKNFTASAQHQAAEEEKKAE